MQYKTENSTLCSNFQSLVQCTERFSLCVMGTCQLIQRTSRCTLRKTSCCSRNVTSAGWCFVVYENHPPHLAHCVCHNQDLDAAWQCFPPSDYDATFAVYVGEVASDPVINADVPWEQPAILYRKKYTDCTSARSALANLCICVVATVLVGGNRVPVGRTSATCISTNSQRGVSGKLS